MHRGVAITALVFTAALCARPYSGRVKIAEETLMQAQDLGLPYQVLLDGALDGKPADFAAFIGLWHRLDAAGAYFHFFHVYEAAEITGDARFLAAVKILPPADLPVLAIGLREARGWLKGRQEFSAAFPQTFAYLRSHMKTGDF